MAQLPLDHDAESASLLFLYSLVLVVRVVLLVFVCNNIIPLRDNEDSLTLTQVPFTDSGTDVAQVVGQLLQWSQGQLFDPQPLLHVEVLESLSKILNPKLFPECSTLAIPLLLRDELNVEVKFNCTLYVTNKG